MGVSLLDTPYLRFENTEGYTKKMWEILSIKKPTPPYRPGPSV